jgi:hypothetical protein
MRSPIPVTAAGALLGRRRHIDQTRMSSGSGGRTQTSHQSSRRSSGTVWGSSARPSASATVVYAPDFFPGRGLAHDGEIGMGQHRQRDVAVPAGPRAHFVLTRMRRQMQSLPISLLDKALINRRDIAPTLSGHVKEFSSFGLPKHRSAFNAFTSITAAIIAYQIDPRLPKPVSASVPLPNL